MPIFVQVLKLVGEPPGSYAYHLVLLFALEAAAAIALSQWRNRRDTARLTFAAGLLFVLRLGLLTAALLASASLFDSLTFLPPLDRAVSTLTLLFIIWAFAFPQTQRAADAAFAGLALFILIALGTALLLWAQEVASGATFYNASLQDPAWTLAQIALIMGGLILLLVRQKPDWLLGLGLLLLLLTGHGLHLLITVQFSNVPNAVRLAELVALPIFTAMVYRRAHAAETITTPLAASGAAGAASTVSSAPTAATEPALRARASLDLKAATALASLSAASSLEELAELMLLALAHAFRADITLLITPPDSSGIASIAGGYDLIREKFLPGASLPLSEVPDLALGLYRGQPTRLASDQHRTEIRFLTASVGVDHTGPALMAPLLSEQGALSAAAVLISAYSAREWTADDEQLLAALAEPLAAAIGRAEKSAQLQQTLEQTRAEAESAQAARETAGQLTNERDAARAEAEQLRLELDRVQAEMDQQREEAEALTRELKARYEAEVRQSELADEINTLRAHLQQAERETEAREQLEADLSAAQERVEALAELEARLENVTREIEASQQRAHGLAEELERARAEAGAASAQSEAHRQRAQALEVELERARAGAREAGAQAEAHQQRLQELAAELEAARATAQPLSQKQTAVIEPQAPDLERARAELEETLARRYAAERDQLKDDLQLAVENLRLQSSLTADLQMELTTYKQLETQLRRELELTRAELKKFVEAAEAGASLKAVVGPAVAGAHASLDEAEAELAAISQQLAEALDQLSRKERQLAKAQEALTALSGQSKPLEEMRAQLAEKDNLIANLTRQNEALAQTGTLLAEKERQLNDAQLLISELYEQTRAVPALQEQIAEIERAGAERAAEAEQLRNQLAEAQTQLQEKERQLGAAVADLAALAGPTAASPEIAEAQAALEQAREELAAQERQLAAQARDLAAMAQPMTAAPFSAPSHEVILSLVQELRQPMSSIVGYSDLLLGESVGILGALQRKFLERIMASCERMEALLDDLIRVTALDSGKLKVARDSLDVMAVVEEAILGCGAQFREKSINLRLDLADNLPSMFADRDALRQIVSHLLNNAASASAIDGEVTLSVRVQAATGPQAGDSADGLLISVRDSGGGIAPEDQPRVFSRTYRADAPLIAGLGDTAGMGLFIAKALTEAQSGRIWLTSEVGKGSTFSVMLPLAGQPIAAGDNGSDPADN